MASILARFIRPATPIVDAYLDACRGRGLKPKTVTGYAELLGRLAREQGRLPVRAEQLEVWLGAMELANESRRDYVKILRRFFAWAAERYGVPNAAGPLAMPPKQRKVRRAFTPAECRSIWRACADDLDRALVALVFDTGMRLEEISKLTSESITPGGLHVDGKGGHERLVDIDPAVVTMLIVLASESPDGRQVWISQRGRKALGRRGLQQRWRRMIRRAGVTGKRRGIHTGRHTHATYSLAAGEYLGNLQERLGHADPRTTMEYVHHAERIRIGGKGRVSPFEQLVGSTWQPTLDEWAEAQQPAPKKGRRDG